MRTLSTLTLALIIAIPAFGRQDASPADDLRRARAEISEIESMLGVVREPQVRALLASRLDRVDRHLSSAERDLSTMQTRGIGAAEATSLLRSARFDDERLDVVNTLARHGRFTVAEIQGFAREFDFDRNRGEALVRLYPACVDAEHYAFALDTLTFRSTKDEVRRRLGL